MIKIENVEISGMEAAIRGMRNPLNSWEKSDSYWTYIEDPTTGQTAKFEYFVGDNDLDLMKRLVKAGTDHGKFLRAINVSLDVTAPLYWWKEADTYKVGTVANSCSTMHKIHAKEFTLDDFSHEHLIKDSVIYNYGVDSFDTVDMMGAIVDMLNLLRDKYLETKDKDYWWQMIQLLPTSYNQKRTWYLNYQVLANMYHSRKDHKLDEWRDFCAWIETLPYFNELIKKGE